MQVLEEILEKACRDEHNPNYPCEATYLFTELCKEINNITEEELLLIKNNAEKYRNFHRNNGYKEIIALYGTESCDKNDCIGPYLLESLAIRKNLKPSTIIQMKDVCKHKYYLNENEKKRAEKEGRTRRVIGWNESWISWKDEKDKTNQKTEETYAEKFRKEHSTEPKIEVPAT